MARLPALVPGDAGLATRLLLIAPAWLMLLVGVLTPAAALMPDQGDVVLYFRTAGALVSGEFPYRDFSFHYPPAALVPMAIPFLGRLLGPVDLGTYRLLFAGSQAITMIALGLVVARIAARLAIVNGEKGPSAGVPTTPDAGPGNPVDPSPDVDPTADVRRVVGRLAALSVGAILALTWRFDLFPALLVMLAVLATIDRRPAWAGVLLGVGVLSKLYPIAVLPALAVPWLLPLDVRALVRLGGTLAITVAAGLLPFVAVAGRSALGFFEYQVGHGIQIESVGGGLTVLAGLLAGTPQPLSFANARVQVEGSLADAWLAVVPLLTVAGFGLLAWVASRHLRRETNDGSRAIGTGTIVAIAGASVMMLLVTSKVYSIQYVVWLLPFMAFLRGRLFAVAVGLTALTIPIHPLLYDELIDQQSLAVLAVNMRNALLVVMTASTLWALGPGRRSRRAEEDRGGRGAVTAAAGS